jgi:hypothetical protein
MLATATTGFALRQVRAALIYQHSSDERQRKLVDAIGEAARAACAWSMIYRLRHADEIALRASAVQIWPK